MVTFLIDDSEYFEETLEEVTSRVLDLAECCHEDMWNTFACWCIMHVCVSLMVVSYTSMCR